MLNTVFRLDIAIRSAGIPIDGIAILDEVAHTVRIDFQQAATAQQRTTAAQIVSTFDWSQAGSDAFDNLQARALVKTIVDGSTIEGKIIKATIMLCLQQIRVAVPLYNPPSKAQIATAFKNIIDGGTAD